MNIISVLAARGRGLFADNKGPWGAPPSGGDGTNDGDPPRAPNGPWGGGGGNDRRPAPGGSAGAGLEELFARGRARFGGGGGGSGGGGGMRGPVDRSLIGWAVLAFLALGLLLTTFHRIDAGERGVVTYFGRYQATLPPGFNMTLPAPLARVEKVNVEEIRNIDLGSTQSEDLMLTGDQNIIDIAYQVRWSIRDPEQFLFELAEPEDTIKQVAESAMRQVVAQVTLQDAIGNRRSEIESLVQQEMQQTLDAYRSGVSIRGVAIKQADPPEAVNDAFKDVTAAQQDAQSEINKANAYALQLRQIAQGEATAFDKVYEQYKLAPEVTRQRMYYETMERVLRGVDKTIVETPNVNTYLPVDQIRRNQGASR